MLRNYQNVVRVFIYAPKDYRANKIMEMYGDSLGAARKSIVRSDNARASDSNRVAGQEWVHPHGYELCIDASIGEDAAANLICDYINRMGTY